MTEWKLIPVEPTPEMIAAMAIIEASSTHTNTYNDGSVEQVSCIGMSGAVEAYEALLAALPTPAPTMVDERGEHLSVCNYWMRPLGSPGCICARASLQSLGGDAAARKSLLPLGFLSNVMTAAGLIEHGRRSKPLAERLMKAVDAIHDANLASLTSTEKSDGGTKDALRTLVEQIEKWAPVDDHGHVFTLNSAFIRAKELL